MIADINITEKSFGPKMLMSGIKFSVDDGEKIGLIGRNGVGKSTLFNVLAGLDLDYSGEIIYKRGATVVATAQEHHHVQDVTVLQYILFGLPEYTKLSEVIDTYPTIMSDDLNMINKYTDAIARFTDKGFYQIEDQIERELENFQLKGVGRQLFSKLSGGQKRLVEVVKVMHSDADLALIDEPTNHMDYVAKAQYIDWMKNAREAMIVITHDRDVLANVDRIVEIKDGEALSYGGNYDAYLRQNAMSTGMRMNDFEMIEKRISNLKTKIIDYRRLKEKSRNPPTIQRFKRLEEKSKTELTELQKIDKPTFWIDKESVSALNYKVASQYNKFKAKNIKMNIKSDESRSRHVLVSARDLSLGYDSALFEGVNIDLREGEALQLVGRNGAGKTTLIKALLDSRRSLKNSVNIFKGEIHLDSQVRVGIYEQEISPKYFKLSLEQAIEKMYLDKDLAISNTKIRGLISDYLFDDGDRKIRLDKLSGGQKARFQIISMLANDPQLLILDEPTNHLDLPSIEELETALAKYSGAIIYVSHDEYFQRAIGGEVLLICQ